MPNYSRKRKNGVKKPRSNRRSNRSRSGVRGYGKYVKNDALKDINHVDPRAGKHFKADYGSRLGGTIGEGLQALASVFGFGEYNRGSAIMMNSCIDMGSSPPSVVNTRSGEGMILRHREYLGDLYSGSGTPSAFTINQYELNIGNSILFPFAAPIAANFQEWEIRGMLVELKTLSSDYASSLSLGSMFLAVDYDSLDAAPTSKQQLENLEYAMSGKPSRSMLMPVECARKNDVLTHLYTAIDGQYNGGDPRFYDIGKLYIGSQGIPTASTPIAEIWITYEVCLFKPRIASADIIVGESVLSDHFVRTGISTTVPLGTTTAIYSGVIGMTFNSLGTQLIFPATITEGNYLVNLYAVGTNATTTAVALNFAGCTPLQYWCTNAGPDLASQVASSNSTSTPYFFQSCIVQINSANALISVSTSGDTFPTAAYMDIFVTQINNKINM